MTERRCPRQLGFSLIEAIIAMIITGIIAGIVSVFMVSPIQAYFDSTRRAAMTDAADTALRRIAYELRGAVPNTVRVSGGNAVLEFVPAQDGGRYRWEAAAPGDNPLDNTTAGDTQFDVLGPNNNLTGAAGDYLVIFNTNQPSLDIYAGCGAGAATNCRTLNAAPGATVNFANTGFFPPFHSPFQRFQLVPATGAVAFGCSAGVAGGNGTGQLRRYTGYAWFNAATPAIGALGTGALLADTVSTCAFTYTPVDELNGLVELRLTIQRENEAVTLVHEVHVDNTP